MPVHSIRLDYTVVKDKLVRQNRTIYRRVNIRFNILSFLRYLYSWLFSIFATTEDIAVIGIQLTTTKSQIVVGVVEFTHLYKHYYSGRKKKNKYYYYYLYFILCNKHIALLIQRAIYSIELKSIYIFFI